MKFWSNLTQGKKSSLMPSAERSYDIKSEKMKKYPQLRWYDNEWGYSNRCVDLAIFIGNKLKDLGKTVTPKAAAKA